MKCFNILIFIFVLLNQSLASADTVVFNDDANQPKSTQTIEPIGEATIHNGKIRLFKINSDLPDEELKKMEKTFATELVYVLKYRNTGELRQFEAMVANPIKKQKGGDKKEKPIIYPFKLVGADYKFDKKNTTNTFIVFKGLDKFKEGWQRQVFLVITGAVALLLIYFLCKLFQITKGKRSESRKKKTYAQSLIDSFNKADNRIDFESIYNNRVGIKSSIEYNEKEMNDFFNHLNRIQYKQFWSDSEINDLKKLHKEVVLVGVKSGI